MKEEQRLFLVHAKSVFSVYRLLNADKSLHRCHALHYLQMATELLGKAYLWKHGPPANTHRAFVSFLKSLAKNRKAQKQLGFEGRNENWEHLIRKSVPLAECIEDLAPALALDAPNPEYPWEQNGNVLVPVDYPFEHLPGRRCPQMRKVLSFLDKCFRLI